MRSRMLLARSDETVHYKCDETVNFCGFRCATTSPITVFINFVFYINLLNKRILIDWSWIIVTPAWTSVWLAWHRAGVVLILSVWQIVLCCVPWLYVVHHLHHLLFPARFCAGSAAVYYLHSGPWSCSREAWWISARVRWQHTDVPSLSSHRYGISRRPTGTLHYRRWMSTNQLKLNMDKTELVWVGSRDSLS